MVETPIEQAFQILVPIKVSKTAVREIFWSAINQGSTYWLMEIVGDESSNLSYSHQLVNGVTLQITALSEDDNNTEGDDYHLTIVNFLDGIKQYVEEYGDCIDNGEVDSCKLDSVDCDIILQYALFGDQLFA